MATRIALRVATKFGRYFLPGTFTVKVVVKLLSTPGAVSVTFTLSFFLLLSDFSALFRALGHLSVTFVSRPGIVGIAFDEKASVLAFLPFDFGNFTRDKQGTRRRAALPSAADAWISNVEKDSDYVLLDELRDPMIHRHLVRTHHVSTHTPPHLLQRTSFHLPSGPVDARVAIERCVAVAVRHVDAFGGLIVSGSIG